MTKTTTTTTTTSKIVAHVWNVVVLSCIGQAAWAFGRSTSSNSGGNDGILQTMAFYGVYHSDPMNQAIHFVFVPILVWTYLVFAAHLPLPFVTIQVPAIGLGGFGVANKDMIPAHEFSWATLLFIGYVWFYFTIDWIGALFYTPVLCFMYGTAVRWHASDQQRASSSAFLSSEEQLPSSPTSATLKAAHHPWGTGILIRNALLLHIFGWYMQIHPGHRIFEDGQPAIMQSLGGALTSAPLYAFYEGVWACGMRQNLHQNVLMRVDQLRHDLCEHGSNMRSCQTIQNDYQDMLSVPTYKDL